MDSFNTEGECVNWFTREPVLINSTEAFDVGSNVQNVQITVMDIDSGTETICPVMNTLRKWKMPTCGGSQDANRNIDPWVMNLKVRRTLQVTPAVSSWVQFVERRNLIQVLIENRSCSQAQNPDANLIEDYLTIHLQNVLDMCTDETGTLVKLFLCFQQQSEITNYDVCQFEVKELQAEVQICEVLGYNDGGSIPIREKKQKVTGPHKSRCQRLERKDLFFILKTNIAHDDFTLTGYVKRSNDRAMIGKEKAVIGDTEVPLQSVTTNNMEDSNDPQTTNHVYNIQADLDPDQFYVDHPGKELYTSHKATPENNTFIFGIRITVGRQSFKREVYQFKTKSKEYSMNKHQFISAIELEATRAQIKDLSIEKLKTTRGDIAYYWQLLDSDTTERYEEGDVMGIFPNKAENQTYLDLLTPDNYKEALLAGVITRSYYIAANSQEGDEGKPVEKICMVGRIPIKVYGPVKHGDFIFASNKLPGVGVTEEQLIADKGNWRDKRLLGYSVEANQKHGVKLVGCIVSILLSINNDQVERLLAKLESTLCESVDRKIDEFRDDVDIKMDGMNHIVSTTQDYVATKRREISRRTRRVCSVIILFFIIGILSCYFFLSPTSPYIKWICRRGSLPGSIMFKIENQDDEELVRMEGILFDVKDLREKIHTDFALKENFTGSYYFNLRKCKRENIRKVLGWFSNPPLYSRTQVFAAVCNCSKVFHYHEYREWIEYHVIKSHCQGQKAPECDQTTDHE